MARHVSRNVVDQYDLRRPLAWMERYMVLEWLCIRGPKTLEQAWCEAPTFGSMVTLLGALYLARHVPAETYLRVWLISCEWMSEENAARTRAQYEEVVRGRPDKLGFGGDDFERVIVSMTESVMGIVVLAYPQATPDLMRERLPWSELHSAMEAYAKKRKKEAQ